MNVDETYKLTRAHNAMTKTLGEFIIKVLLHHAPLLFCCKTIIKNDHEKFCCETFMKI